MFCGARNKRGGAVASLAKINKIETCLHNKGNQPVVNHHFTLYTRQKQQYQKIKIATILSICAHSRS
jgi:hypothetical protein